MTSTRAKKLDIRAEASAAIKGLAELDAAIERARTLIPPVPVVPVDTFLVLQQAIAACVDTVLAGNPMPERPAGLIVDAIAGSLEAGHHASVVRGVEDTLRGMRDQAFLAGVDAAFAVLREHLERILSQVRGSSATDLQHLVDEYDQVRSVQFSLASRAARLTSTNANRPANLVATAGLVRDFIDLFAPFEERRQSAVALSQPVGTPAAVYREWLGALPPVTFAGDRDASPWWLTDDPTSHLMWLAKEGQPWLPTFRELESAHSAATAATTRVIGQVNSLQEDARTRYYDITGARDTYAGMPREQRPEPATWTAPPRIQDRPKPRTWLQEQQASA